MIFVHYLLFVLLVFGLQSDSQSIQPSSEYQQSNLDEPNMLNSESKNKIQFGSQQINEYSSIKNAIGSVYCFISGNDENGDGSQIYPYRTIRRSFGASFSEGESRRTVILGTGAFENETIDNLTDKSYSLTGTSDVLTVVSDTSTATQPLFYLTGGSLILAQIRLVHHVTVRTDAPLVKLIEGTPKPNGGRLEINNCVFLTDNGNIITSSSFIQSYDRNGTVIVRNTRFYNGLYKNMSSFSAGQSQVITLEYCTFIGLQIRESYGGAIFLIVMNGGTYTIRSCTFDNCSSNLNGGAIHFSLDRITDSSIKPNEGKLQIYGTVIENCRAKFGGAIDIEGSNFPLYMEDSIFSSNTASDVHGGNDIYFRSYGNAVILREDRIKNCVSDSNLVRIAGQAEIQSGDYDYLLRPYSSSIYVNAQSVYSPADGTQNKPFKLVSSAISMLETTGIKKTNVIIVDGEYNEPRRHEIGGATVELNGQGDGTKLIFEGAGINVGFYLNDNNEQQLNIDKINHKQQFHSRNAVSYSHIHITTGTYTATKLNYHLVQSSFALFGIWNSKGQISLIQCTVEESGGSDSSSSFSGRVLWQVGGTVTVTNSKFIGGKLIAQSNNNQLQTNKQQQKSNSKQQQTKQSYPFKPSNSIRTNDPFPDAEYQQFCSWTNTLIDTKETDITFSHSNFTNWWIGIVSVNSGVLTVDDCLFYGNGELNEQFPYVRQNIRCYQGMVDVKSMRDEDGLAGGPASPLNASSLWILNQQNTYATQNLAAIRGSSPFQAYLSQAQIKYTGKKTGVKQYEISFIGKDIVPCGSFFEIFEVSNDGERNRTRHAFNEIKYAGKNNKNNKNEYKLNADEEQQTVNSEAIGVVTSDHYGSSFEWRGYIIYGANAELSTQAVPIQGGFDFEGAKRLRTTFLALFILFLILAIAAVVILIIILRCFYLRKKSIDQLEEEVYAKKNQGEQLKAAKIREKEKIQRKRELEKEKKKKQKIKEKLKKDKEKERIRLKKQKELDKARNRRNQRSGTDDRGVYNNNKINNNIVNKNIDNYTEDLTANIDNKDKNNKNTNNKNNNNNKIKIHDSLLIVSTQDFSLFDSLTRNKLKNDENSNEKDKNDSSTKNQESEIIYSSEQIDKGKWTDLKNLLIIEWIQ